MKENKAKNKNMQVMLIFVFFTDKKIKTKKGIYINNAEKM